MTKEKFQKMKLVKKSVKGLLSVIVLIGLFAMIISCDNDTEPYKPPMVTHKVVLKAEASAGSNIKSTKYSVNSTEPITESGLSGTTWTKEGETTSSEGKGYTWNVEVQSAGANDSSTLKVQIYVDGVLKKEVISVGKDITINTSYSY